MIINIHGFKGNGNNTKYQLLLKHFDKELIYSPTMPVAPMEAIELLDSFIVNDNNYPHILVGTSLGGFYAYCLFNRFDCPTHLINPSLTPWVSLSKEIGMQTRFDTNEPFEWKQEYIQELIVLNSKIDPDERINSLLNFYLGENDELISHEYLKTEFKYCPKIWTDDTHQFSEINFEKYVIPKIKERLAKKDNNKFYL